VAVFASAGGQQSLTVAGASSRQESTVSLVAANTEYSFSLPANTRKFLIYTEGGSAFKLSQTATGSSSGMPVPRWCFYQESDLTVSGLVLYFQSPVALEVMRIIVWT
jgi:hypothetical protein